jgi:hypothetical protein
VRLPGGRPSCNVAWGGLLAEKEEKEDEEEEEEEEAVVRQAGTADAAKKQAE